MNILLRLIIVAIAGYAIWQFSDSFSLAVSTLAKPAEARWFNVLTALDEGVVGPALAVAAVALAIANKRLRLAAILLESVRRDHTGLHSFLNMSLMEARRRNASALRLRFSQSLASRLHRPSHANVRSTTHRFGKTTKPLARSERLTISTFTCVIIFVTARRNTGP